jgi:AcrR family transcriptional regulator
MDATTSAANGGTRSAGYRRSARSPRGEARRLELLQRVTDDLAANGLVGFSLRRAAKAAGTTHKVLLYHFEGADDLLRQAISQLRERRLTRALEAGSQAPAQTLAERARAAFPSLVGEESPVLDQAIGLAMFDPARYGELGWAAPQEYMPGLLAICPPAWADQRKVQVAEMIMATMRGFIVSMTTGNTASAEAGLEALVRALEREEAAAE